MTHLRRATVGDAAAIAALHADRIEEGFLVTLGPGFLRRLYARIVRSPHSFVLVSDGAHDVEGFVAVADDTGRLYREFLWRDGVLAAVEGARGLLRSPRRVWETFRYGAGSDDELPAAEILAIAVARGSEGTGRGGALLLGALEELGRRGIGAARVMTRADNAAAIRMYERAGFRRHRVTEVHHGVRQELLVWR